MAKSFKKLPVRASPEKPTSAQDFFDLVTEPLPLGERGLPPSQDTPPPPVRTETTSMVLEQPRPPRRRADPKPTETPGKLTSPAPRQEPPPTEQAPLSEKGTRQTFVVGVSRLERLRDFVHERHVQGDYLYSQRQALEEALELLFAKFPPAQPRPAHLREWEAQQRARIQQGCRADRRGTSPPAHPLDQPA